MRNFKEHYSLFLEFFDAIDDAVKHIDHLEENILNKGKQGVKEALDQIQASIDYFVDETEYKISTKFDGAPAIVAGLDRDGRFFVASKSAFAKNPKINYTEEDININHSSSPGLKRKLKLALRYLPSLNIKGIYQMDYMFDNDIKNIETPNFIDGVKNENKFITFQPNTIKYAVTPESEYGEEILKAKIGVAVHIEYTIKNGILKVKKYTTSPNEFSPSKTVFVFNVLIDKPKNAKSKFGEMLIKDVTKKRGQVLRLASRVDFSGLADYTTLLKSYINSEVKEGRFLEDTSISAQQFISYITKRYEKDISKMKSERGVAKKRQEMRTKISELKSLKNSIRNAFEITKVISNLKNSLIIIFNEITKNDILGTYLEESPGIWQTTSPEGFALSKTSAEGAEITKMVNRKEFSAANFASGAPGAHKPETQPEQPNNAGAPPPIL